MRHNARQSDNNNCFCRQHCYYRGLCLVINFSTVVRRSDNWCYRHLIYFHHRHYHNYWSLIHVIIFIIIIIVIIIPTLADYYWYFYRGHHEHQLPSTAPTPSSSSSFVNIVIIIIITLLGLIEFKHIGVGTTCKTNHIKRNKILGLWGAGMA